MIVLNDNHNTFDGVAGALSRVLPGVSLDQGYAIADKIHNTGQAIVWSGPKETAELYWEQLKEAGLDDGSLWSRDRSARAAVRPPSGWLTLPSQ